LCNCFINVTIIQLLIDLLIRLFKIPHYNLLLLIWCDIKYFLGILFSLEIRKTFAEMYIYNRGLSHTYCKNISVLKKNFMKKLNIKYKSIEWTIQTILDSEDSIEWDDFCEHFKAKLDKTSDLDISLYYFDFFYLFEERINWSAFCKNKNIHWGHFLHTILPYEINNQYRKGYEIIKKNSSKDNTKLISLQLIKRINLFTMFFHKWDWDAMSGNEYIPHNIWKVIFTNYENIEIIPKLNFKKLSLLTNIPWDLTLYYGQEKNSVLDYSEQWDWEEIVTNKSIKWNKRMITDHAKHFPWEGKSGGSTGKYWYSPSVIAHNGHIHFPSEVLKQYTNNWVEGMFDGCTRTDSEGDWIIFSRNHSINIDILKEFSTKLDLGEVIKNKMDWSLEELRLINNIIAEKRFWPERSKVLKNLISKENVKELILIEMLNKI
jgi:hypothetical protein